MKEWICTIAGIVGGFIATLFGGWDSALATLVVFMGIDFSYGMFFVFFFILVFLSIAIFFLNICFLVYLFIFDF